MYTTPNGSSFWGIEANFRDPATICTADSTGDVAYGDRLWIANGSHSEYVQMPLTENADELAQLSYVLGGCTSVMSTHWWRYNFPDAQSSCNDSFPIFLLYDDG